MMTMNGKQHFSMHAALHEPKYSGLHAGSEGMRRVCLSAPQGNLFGGFDESLLARAEALAAADGIVPHGKSHPFKADVTYHTMSSVPCTSSSAHVPVSHSISSHHHHHHLLGPQSLEAADLLEHPLLQPVRHGDGSPPGGARRPTTTTTTSSNQQHHHHHLQTMGQLHQAMASMHPHALSVHGNGGGMACSVNDVESDPRELEAFAERFKQRRIKLGVTQADVGSALANLKIPGVGSLSQSTICRFESLTLSHNNMIALKPVLQAWLEEAEAAYREKNSKPDLFNGSERKRKRTSIAAPEKRSLEAYFAIQPRPSSEKIAAIAEKLELKKNVVRVWFCNQRQKQKRMKYSAVH
ncbi:LOW QUALITY PROTEIN: POU domain, class 4, transcription factor 3 [Gadus macrocephalus]|uniref:LOW QUALITY PROTEIN: POU domain, class 4, transcription factor 3 n=1 Tax=Gadus macrocephalus TaxID=80720 RepID=UPI0028CB7080|nr:LOW QUALITY PROTEIN: POU domain, class 4, transcription factor 3 [Gadus macrocephalus]